MNVKRFITEIREDKLVSRSLAAGVALFVLVAALLWHPVMVDGRTQALDRHFGLSMKIVASRIDATRSFRSSATGPCPPPSRCD